jgi:ATP adenylyltransferase
LVAAVVKRHVDEDQKRLERLWAPWRLVYVTGEQGGRRNAGGEEQIGWLPGADRNCFLCRDAADPDQRGNLVVRRTRHSLVVLNRYPYNNGHLLISPLAHKARLDQLSTDERLDCLQTIVEASGVLERKMHAEGFNVGLNLGQAAGAGVPGHLHWHVVPRWSGDTNFMPTLAGVRVIPQSLEALWEILSMELDAGRTDR